MLIGALALATGCSQESPDPAPAPRPSVALRVLVVNEPGLAEAIDRLRGEWAEQSGGELRTSNTQWTSDTTAQQLDVDVIVFPSRYLGEFCSRGWLRPVRPNVFASEQLQASDFFPIARGRLIHWGDEPIALPLGVDPSGARQGPSAPAALKYLEHAAPNVMSNARLGEFFEAESMRPRIAEPPFVDALKTFVAGESNSSAGQSQQTTTIPVLGYTDRLIAVTSTSRNAASAFKLLAWLADSETSTHLARAGNGTMPVRRSLATAPSWYDASLSASERAEQGERLERALSEGGCLMLPRIPGVDEYLGALESAVNAAAGGGHPKLALDVAANQWEEITMSHGRDAQRQAYLKQLGIDEP